MNKENLKPIIFPHFYRLNWAREMSEFLINSGNFHFDFKNSDFGNYSKAQKISSDYIDEILKNKKKNKGRTLLFVNLNDFIFSEKRDELKENFNIAGFMRGSRHYDSEPGNASFKKEDLVLARNKEKEGLLMVDNLFLGTETFKNFLFSEIPELKDKKINVLGIPIFAKPIYLNKDRFEQIEFLKKKEEGLILWNHRLQKQKNPHILFLLNSVVKNNMAVCTPEALSAAYSKEMKEHENIFKYILRDNGKRRNEYLNILNKAKVVISFASHETWGNSMIEGIMSGAAPFAPDNIKCSYKELYPECFLYPSDWIEKNNLNNDEWREKMYRFSHHIAAFSSKDWRVEVKNLQIALYEKYNKDIWLNNLLNKLI